MAVFLVLATIAQSVASDALHAELNCLQCLVVCVKLYILGADCVFD